MSFKILRHAKVEVPDSLAPQKAASKEIAVPKKSLKERAQKSVGGIFALSGTAFVASPIIGIMATVPVDLSGLFLGSAAGLLISSVPVIGSYFNKTYKYVPFKQAEPEVQSESPVYFEPYRNWDEVFVTYADRLVDKNIECDTPVGFVTIASRNGADMYKIRQERLKGNSNISWAGVYGEVSEYTSGIFFRTIDETGSVLFHEETSN